MKIYISLDMEGVAGTFDWTQEKTDRASVRQCMARQLEWVIEGIRASRVNKVVEEILVADSHSRGDNLTYEITALDERLCLLSGDPRPCYMMPALDSGYDVVFLVGYHSGGGTLHGVMDHTYTSNFHTLSLQGRPMSEALLNAAYAGSLNVPVGLVIGDEALRLDLMQQEGMPWVHYVTTKTGLSRLAAKHKSQATVRRETVEAVRSVLEGDLAGLPLYRFEAPFRLTATFQTTVMADVAQLVPGVKRIDGRTVELIHDDFTTLYNAREVLAILAGTVVGR